MPKRKYKKIRRVVKEFRRDLERTVFPISTKNSDDLKTVERVMNKSTALCIQKCINHGDINEFFGCISTGKEACVFYCPSDKYGPCAMKIHQTTGMSVFKDRDRYTNNHHKFRRGCVRINNARHQIRLWALQEFINIHKLLCAGVAAPRPYVVRAHMFLMEFIGEGEIAAPLLKSVVLNLRVATEMYRTLVRDMRTMYRVCKIVHGDLSDYNMLVYKNKLYIIDMSQSVGPGHPFCDEFLARDCFNVTECFRRRGVATLTVKELFFFIVDKAVTDANKDDCFEKFMQRAEERGVLPPCRKEERSQEVFHGLPYVPQSFCEMTSYLKLGHQETLIDQRQLHELDCQALFEITAGRPVSLPVAPSFPFEDPSLIMKADQASLSCEGSSEKENKDVKNTLIVTVEGGYSVSFNGSQYSSYSSETKECIFKDPDSEVVDLSKKTLSSVLAIQHGPPKIKRKKPDSDIILGHPFRQKWETTEERKTRKSAVKRDQAYRRRVKAKSGKKKKRGPKNRRKCGVKKKK